MTDFKTHTIDSAPAAARPLLEGAKANFGFLPNLLGNMATAPATLEGYLTIAGIFNKTNLSETERQIILMTNNRLNGCEYCMAAHTTLSKMGGVPQDVIDALRNNTAIADRKLEALRMFTAEVNQTRGHPSKTTTDNLLAAGYTEQTILEVILGTAMKLLSNYVNHITKTEVDGVFQANAWTA